MISLSISTDTWLMMSQTYLVNRVINSPLDYDNYVGKIGISRIFNGVVRKGDNIMLAKADGELVKGKVSKLIGFHGLNRMEIEEAEAGDGRLKPEPGSLPLNALS